MGFRALRPTPNLVPFFFSSVLNQFIDFLIIPSDRSYPNNPAAVVWSSLALGHDGIHFSRTIWLDVF